MSDEVQREVKKRGPRSNQKLKLFYLKKILERQTDEDHGISLEEIIDRLAAQDVTAERKSLYDDFKQLETFGVDVISEKVERRTFYKLASRDFELAEVKLLVDLIQSSKFVTTKKSKELIKKLEKLVSDRQASDLQRQVYVDGRNKTDNETILYLVDTIHRAINDNRTIKFYYYRWSFNTNRKVKEYRHDKKLYEVSPIALIWSDENYYLVAYDPEADMIKHYRVDKMDSIEVTESKRPSIASVKKLNVAEYVKRRYNMYDGEEFDLELICNDYMVNTMVDFFGQDVRMYRLGPNEVKVSARTVVNNQFLGWLLSLGEGVRLVGPDSALALLKEFIEKANELYNIN